VRLLTLARDLQRRKARERSEYFVAEGVRTIEELLRSPLAIRGVLISPQLAATTRGEALRSAVVSRGLEVTEVSEAEFASAAQTESPQGVLAIAAIPPRSLDAVPVDRPARFLVLDAVQDPGNVGTMLRTAGALGAAATVALPGTVDLWNAKVVRSATGTHFSRVAVMTTWAELDGWRRAHDVSLWGADAHGEPLAGMLGAVPARLAIVVGNEGAGLTPAARERSERLVALPSLGVDSLNVAVAAGILLYELRR
jgi:RNA methyltransferase, TrmH family